jgi:hypothetical protein
VPLRLRVPAYYLISQTELSLAGKLKPPRQRPSRKIAPRQKILALAFHCNP